MFWNHLTLRNLLIIKVKEPKSVRCKKKLFAFCVVHWRAVCKLFAAAKVWGICRKKLCQGVRGCKSTLHIRISRCSKLFYTISRCHFHIEITFSRRICSLRPRSHSPLCSLTRRNHLRPDNALSM